MNPAQFGAAREDIRLALEREDIESRPLWKPMHLQPIFQCNLTMKNSAMQFRIETEQETDGRWIAEVMDIPGVIAYGEDSARHASSQSSGA